MYFLRKTFAQILHFGRMNNFNEGTIITEKINSRDARNSSKSASMSTTRRNLRIDKPGNY